VLLQRTARFTAALDNVLGVCHWLLYILTLKQTDSVIWLAAEFSPTQSDELAVPCC
jgi:hypothetical protein